MKYWELISVGGKTSLPTPPVSNESSSSDILDEKIQKIMDYMENLSKKNNTIPIEEVDTILNEEQSVDVLTMLLDFEKKYFMETPLSEMLEKRFVWNIPKPIYDAARHARDCEYPDCLNPLFWFYLFCTEAPGDMIGKFIVTAMNSMSDEDIKIVEQYADEYDSVYGEEI